MKQLKVINPTGVELSILDRRILPWNKAPEGQVVHIEPARADEFYACVKNTGLPLTVEDATPAKSRQASAGAEPGPEPEAEKPQKTPRKPKAKTTQTTEKADS